MVVDRDITPPIALRVNIGGPTEVLNEQALIAFLVYRQPIRCAKFEDSLPLAIWLLHCRTEAHRDRYLAGCTTAPFYYYLCDVLAPGRRYFFANMLGAAQFGGHDPHKDEDERHCHEHKTRPIWDPFPFHGN